MTPARLCLLLLLLTTPLLSCGEVPAQHADPEPGDGGFPHADRPDGATGVADASIAADANACVDASAFADGGEVEDSGIVADASEALDAGGDAEEQVDAGVSADANGFVDAGAFADGGGVEDSGIVADAGETLDSGGLEDAGEQTDAALVADASIAADANAFVDAGAFTDGGIVADGGEALDSGGFGDAGEQTDAGTTELPVVSSNPDMEFTGRLEDGVQFRLAALAADFGTAPVIYGYTDFREQVIGQPWNQLLQKGTARPDSWGNTILAGRGASNAVDLIHDGTPLQSQIRLWLPHVTRLFISRALRIREGGTWVGSKNWPSGEPTIGEFPDDSCFKFSWAFFIDDDSHSPSNLCIPTHVGGGIMIGGNSHVSRSATAGSSALSYSSWIVVDGFAAADPANPYGNGGPSYIGIYSDQINRIAWNHSTTVFALDQGDYFESVFVPGWIDVNDRARISQTDVYVADRSERLLIANHFDLMQASKVVVQPHESWSNREITAVLRLGDIDPAVEPVYLLFRDYRQDLAQPLALSNPLSIPTGVEAVMGAEVPTTTIYAGEGRFFLDPHGYLAGEGEIVTTVGLWSRADGTAPSTFALYEADTDDYTGARKVAEIGRANDLIVDDPTIAAPRGAQLSEALLNHPLTAGKHYWLAAQVGSPYPVRAAGSGILKSDAGLQPPERPSEAPLSPQGYRLALFARVVRLQ